MRCESINYKYYGYSYQLSRRYIASTKAMSCANGREAVELLIKSDRIQGDLETYADSTDNANGNEPFNLIIREFVPFDVSQADLSNSNF